MGLHRAVEELQQNLIEIKKQQRLKHLRKILKFLLVGFFIGRDANQSARAKTYDLKSKKILQKLESGMWSRKQRTFCKLAVKVYESYQEKLNELQKVDFEDMINIAVDELKHNNDLYKNIYDHILVDEYQDISAQRYKLIKGLLDQNPECKLFCV